MKYVFLLLFVVSTAVHLFASGKNSGKLRSITKPLLLTTLLGFYVCAAQSVSVFVVLALAFSWLGDVLLMGRGIKWFVFGGISFMVSHAFFIVSYFDRVDFSRIKPAVIIFFAAAFACAVSIIFRHLKPYLSKALFYPMFLYLLVNGSMNCFAIYRMISCPEIQTVLTCIGAFLFFISDTDLFFVRFSKSGQKRTHFLVMLTYTVGEFLIVSGLL